jgi:hypothetical protein
MRKLPKFPKAPKLSSSLAVWQRYEQRCADVSKKRADIKAEPSKKAAIKRKAEVIKNKTR